MSGALRIIRKFSGLLDVNWSAIADGQYLMRSGSTIVGGAGGGAAFDPASPGNIGGTTPAQVNATGFYLTGGGFNAGLYWDSNGFKLKADGTALKLGSFASTTATYIDGASGAYVTIRGFEGIQLQGGYLSFGTGSTGSAGYGIRDNGGNLEFKNSGSVWTSFNGSPVPSAYDDDFSGSSLNPKWTSNFTAGATLKAGCFECKSSTTAATDLKKITQNFSPAGSFRVRTLLSQYVVGGVENYGGIVLVNGGTGNQVVFYAGSGASNNRKMGAARISATGTTTAGIGSLSLGNDAGFGSEQYTWGLQVRYDSGTGTIYMDWSRDGITFVNSYSEPLASHLVAVTKAGLFSADGAQGVRFEWFRVDQGIATAN